ncbi:unnamed protein product, partial [Mesorhabditis spiculigera]
MSPSYSRLICERASFVQQVHPRLRTSLAAPAVPCSRRLTTTRASKQNGTCPSCSFREWENLGCARAVRVAPIRKSLRCKNKDRFKK